MTQLKISVFTYTGFPSDNLSLAASSGLLRLTNDTKQNQGHAFYPHHEANNGNANNQVFAVELDTIQSKEFNDINDDHVGIDINGLISEKSSPARYFASNNSLPLSS
ncbi:Lectin-like protein [Prunus dulcis]|uniref:Lectin-like protein n=1 Tax=Prunus dulcis TaxID=3755 RepID=A0A4Y1RPK9_PRUDU|nr:Lectin-like protein [Prunus dulcis]